MELEIVLGTLGVASLFVALAAFVAALFSPRWLDDLLMTITGVACGVGIGAVILMTLVIAQDWL